MMMIASSADTVLALDAMRLLSLPVTQSPQDQWINSTFNIAWCRDDGVIAARKLVATRAEDLWPKKGCRNIFSLIGMQLRGSYH